MNESTSDQLYLDLRSGRPTTVHRDTRESAGLRATCAALNRQRTRGIQAISRQVAPRKSLPVDVWTTSLERSAAQWDIPLIPLTNLGIEIDSDGFQFSSQLQRLRTGAEATAWLDEAERCVYKTFDLRESGALGKRLLLFSENEFECTIRPEDATLEDTLEKLNSLHNAGACHTEIIGLAASGDFLLVKQPFCFPFEDFVQDRDAAIEAIRAVPAKGISARGFWVYWEASQPWCIGDLHKGNIMRLPDKQPTIIDALLSPIPPALLNQLPILKSTVHRAKQWFESGILPEDNPFEGVHDDEL